MSEFCLSNGMTLHYEDTGSGQPVCEETEELQKASAASLICPLQSPAAIRSVRSASYAVDYQRIDFMGS